MKHLARGGVHIVVSALTLSECVELELMREADACSQAGLEYISVPIEDRSVPESHHAFMVRLEGLAHAISNGAHVVVHCRQGIGRASLIAVGVLCVAGWDEELAWRRVEEARGRPMPDTPEQRSWWSDVTRAL